MDGLFEIKNKKVSENIISRLTFKPWRVFINHVDGYHGKKLADYLLTHSHGESMDFTKREDILSNQNVVKDIQIEDSLSRTRTPPAVSEKCETRNYEIIGTVTGKGNQVPKNVRIIDVSNREILLEELMCCGYIIYDISLDDDQIQLASWSIKAIARELECLSKSKDASSGNSTKDSRFFLLISNIMTWARTKSLDPKNPNAPFTEADYAKRIAHPNFKQHLHSENDVLTLKKYYNVSLKLRTLVLCCGITYGDEQGPLNFLFQLACDDSKHLPIFGDGTNKIPLLHIAQLASIVHSILNCWPEKIQYLVATELEPISQITIVKKINGAFASAGIKYLDIDETNQLTDFTRRDYDIMTVNVNIEPAYTLEKCLQSNDTFEMNFRNVVKEYRICHNSLPVKIIIVGPPAIGKTTLSKRLSNYYHNSYVNEKSLITETLQNLTSAIEGMNSENDENVDGDNVRLDKTNDEVSGFDHEKNVSDRIQLIDQLNDMRNNLAKNNGHLDEQLMNKILYQHLSTRKCLNKGYVIDDYPKTSAQAEKLFGSSMAMNNLKNNNTTRTTKNDNEYLDITPQLVIVLEASDEFLLNRIINLPERETQRTNHSVETILRRLRKYRKQSADDNINVVKFFVDNAVPILIVPITDDSLEMHSSFQKCIGVLGKPQHSEVKTNVTELNEIPARVETELIPVAPGEDITKDEQAHEKHRKRDKIMLEWTIQLKKILQDEETILQQLSEPLRLYLVVNIFPTLTKGLFEVARDKPDDPVDFLAEFLFKNNPDGRMLEGLK